MAKKCERKCCIAKCLLIANRVPMSSRRMAKILTNDFYIYNEKLLLVPPHLFFATLPIGDSGRDGGRRLG